MYLVSPFHEHSGSDDMFWRIRVHLLLPESNFSDVISLVPRPHQKRRSILPRRDQPVAQVLLALLDDLLVRLFAVQIAGLVRIGL